MCATCGCGKDAATTVLNLQTGTETVLHRHHHDHRHGQHHHHDHGHDHGHQHHHHDGGATIDLEARILAKNDALAAKNRAWFAGRKVLALNLVSAPGSGKTTLLERTIRDLKDELPLAVLEGDQATANDAERIRAAGAPVVQINTGAGCHLEADMVARGVAELKPGRGLGPPHRECRKPRLPRALRSRRARQGRNPLRHGGRGQAAQIPAHVPRRRRDDPEQDRPPAARRFRRDACDRECAEGQPEDRRAAAFRADRRRARRMVRLAAQGGGGDARGGATLNLPLVVVPGLDSEASSPISGATEWIAGSSPAMTTRMWVAPAIRRNSCYATSA